MMQNDARIIYELRSDFCLGALKKPVCLGDLDDWIVGVSLKGGLEKVP